MCVKKTAFISNFFFISSNRELDLNFSLWDILDVFFMILILQTTNLITYKIPKHQKHSLLKSYLANFIKWKFRVSQILVISVFLYNSTKHVNQTKKSYVFTWYWLNRDILRQLEDDAKVLPLYKFVDQCPVLRLF